MITAALNRVLIAVSDMAASVAFYQLLGLELGTGGPHAAHTEFVGPVKVVLNTEPMLQGFDSNWQRPTDGLAMLLVFECPTPAILDEIVQRMIETGHEISKPPFDAIWGQRYCSIVDPDGNHVNLFAPL